MSIEDLKRQIKGMEAVKERLENKAYGNQLKQQLNARRTEKIKAKIADLETRLKKLEPEPVIKEEPTKKPIEKKTTKKKPTKKSTTKKASKKKPTKSKKKKSTGKKSSKKKTKKKSSK